MTATDSSLPGIVRASKGLAFQVKQTLRQLEPYLPSFAPAPAWRHAFNVFARYGFNPATVFDIGVGFGTFALYRAFPDAFYYLIDPTPESAQHMQRILRRHKGELLNVALADRDGEATLEIRSDIQGSTLFDDYGPRGILRKQTVSLRRFDTVIPSFARPALCKIDVQGAEMLVLNGMTGRLRDVDAFIIEVSTIATVKGGPEIYDVIEFMKRHGFVIFDLVGMKRRPLDGATAQLDLLFVAENAVFRSDHRWAGSASNGNAFD